MLCKSFNKVTIYGDEVDNEERNQKKAYEITEVKMKSRLGR